jgi:ribosomal protein L19E
MDAQKVRNAIVEVSDAMTRAQAERELIREIVKRMHDEEGVDKRVFRKMASVYYKGNFQDETALNEEFETTFTNVMS